MAKHPKPPDEGMVENDLCDLDPAKVCDNCCKCIEKSDADYVDVNASFDLASMRVYYGGDEDEADESALPPMDIDPAMLAEWEERLRQAELADKEAGETGEETPKHDPARMRGSRKKRGKE
jgi:hypothetical protein